MITISDGVSPFQPWDALSYSAESESLNALHEVRAGIDVTLRGEGLRSGDLELLFLTRGAAWSAYALLSQPKTFTLTDTRLPEINMRFVREGVMRIKLDPDTRKRWVLVAGYQEVTL